jgi:hypothetical protein
MNATSDETMQGRRGALQVIEGGKGDWPRRRKPVDSHAFILPPVCLHTRDFRLYDRLGMTKAQFNIAWRIAQRDGNRDHLVRLISSLDRAIEAVRELEDALEDERREVLAIYLRYFPAAARRIMRGLASETAGARP